MNIYEEALEMHKKFVGKIDVVSTVRTDDEHDLALAYSPGVAEPCRVIARDPAALNTYTARGNMIAVVSDGSAVLGLGNIGARAALPVMEGKCVLFKQFGGVSAFPICLDSQDDGVIVDTVKYLEPSFSGINLEDIAAPRCFEIESRLKKETKMLIFHDDQHGTAIVTLAGLLNALRLYGKDIAEIRIVINGAGAAGTSVTGLLNYIGANNIIMCDREGIIHKGREGLNAAKQKLADSTNPGNVKGNLSLALEDADIFIGVSSANVLTPEMIKNMKKNPVIFALANPEPEIKVELAKEYGVKVIATGRSDYSNQVNNVLAFPGIFRGALDAKAKEINMEMKLAAAKAISEIVGNDLREDYIIPKPFDKRVLPAVAVSVAKAALETNNTYGKVDLTLIEKKAKEIVKNRA
ncbi:MAG: NAD-dependent malic enzyme [Actinobacteria bacterium]|nr:NAD-dependent malic enzyme [Actinomycetota bacterium]MCL6088326.1 NAD-dependent malic enzyme [Actinomycetota bacterium]